MPDLRPALHNDTPKEELPSMLRGWLCSLAATLTGGLLGFVLAVIGANGFETYGVVLFMLLPLFVPWLSAWLDALPQQRTFARCCTVAMMTLVWMLVLMLVFAMEGVLCVIMAAPLWIGCALIGASLAYATQRHGFPTALLMVPMLPLLMAAETRWPLDLPVHQVTTRVTIHADPDTVWRHVVSFAPLPEPTDWVFRTGVAYPIRARIEGEGVGAVRYCEFSTGPFVEPIEVWDEPRLLRFSVTENPPPMREWSFYANVDPPHLHGYLESRQGQFLLIANDDGTTTLEGTTWYTNRLWPQAYWALWSDAIIHRIHGRVLDHIKTLAE